MRLKKPHALAVWGIPAIAIAIWLTASLATADQGSLHFAGPFSADPTALPSVRSGEQPLLIRSATSGQLATQGVTLSPARSSAKITQPQAVQKAVSQFPDATVKEVFLAQLHDSYSKVDRLCWGIALSPSTPVTGTYGQPSTYFILFFDAETGEFVEGLQGG